MNKNHQQLIGQLGPEKIIQTLEPFINVRRCQKIATVLDARIESIELALESPANLHNAFAAVRSSEAMGICQVHIINAEGDSTGIRGVTQGTYHWIDIHYHADLKDFLQYKSAKNLLLFGGMPSVENNINNIKIDKPLCLIFGNENRGLSTAAINACDGLFTIPMFGMAESFNLSVSAAISLYDTTQRKRQSLNAHGDLSPQTRLIKQAQYYLNSVNERLVKKILILILLILSLQR